MGRNNNRANIISNALAVHDCMCTISADPIALLALNGKQEASRTARPWHKRIAFTSSSIRQIIEVAVAGRGAFQWRSTYASALRKAFLGVPPRPCSTGLMLTEAVNKDPVKR